MRDKRLAGALLPALLVGWSLSAAEYFVGKQGDDGNDGLGRETAFLTIRRGLRDFRAGDTLTILPGEYEEANELVLDSDPELASTIRAAVPGTVLIRGDRPVDGFEKVSGHRFVWRASWDDKVETVNERDTLRMYNRAATLAEMDNRRAVWYHDPANKLLYIVTSDGESPSTHHHTVSVERDFGLLIRAAKGSLHNMVVDGLSFTGFNCNEYGGLPGMHGRWGLYLVNTRNALVRRCTLFFNGGGIGMSGSAEDCVIEDCVAYANGTRYCSSGGNIVIFGNAFRCAIRRCVAFSSPYAGIRFYMGRLEDCVIEDCVTWGNGSDDIFIKGEPKRSWTRNSVALAGLHSKLTANSVFKYNGYAKPGPDSLNLAGNRLSPDENLADPSRMDYRPMGDSRIAGGLEDRGDVFFLSPDGSDANTGDSIRAPRRTLAGVKAGSTVYLLPGDYPGGEVIAAPGVTLRTRGNGASAVFRGGEFGLEIAATNVSVEGVSFVGHREAGIRVSADGARIISCGFATSRAGIEARDRTGLLIAHNAFAGSLDTPYDLERCGVVARDNLLSGKERIVDGAPYLRNNHRYGDATAGKAAEPDYVDPENGDFSLRNAGDFAGRGSDSLALGPYRLVRGNRPVTITGPFVASVTATTANLEWWTSSEGVTSELSWGEDPSCPKKAGNAYAGGCFHTVSLTGLEPGGEYFFRVDAKSPPFEMHNNPELDAADKLRERDRILGEPMPFRTLAADTEPREFFVAQDGDDDATGGRDSPWRSIDRALRDIVAGDTLTLRGGVYREQVYLRASGDTGRPVTIRGAAGEKVWLDGLNQQLSSFFTVNNKSYIVFRDLHARNLGETKGAVFVLNGGRNITIERVFYDGRARNYTPPIVQAHFSENLALRDSVFFRGFHGASFFRCPGLRIENNVMYINQVNQITINNDADQPVYISRNIVFDSVIEKVRNPLIGLWHLEALRDDGNCFYVRLPAAERSLYGFLRRGGELVPDGERKELNLAELNKLPRRGAPSFIANPRVPALAELTLFDSLADWEASWTAVNKERTAIEYRATADGYEPLEFGDFLPAEPLLPPGEETRPVGLGRAR